jgi:hypothetical protein
MVDILASIGALRPNTAYINPRLSMETWPIVADGAHNSNTDLIYWKNSFYLAHQASVAHFGNEKSRLLVKKSPDAHHWEAVAEFPVPGEELRDPKFAAIGDRLFLYALRNRTWNPEPYTTTYTVSPDGSAWTPLVDVQPEGWLFWHPETFDSVTWYAPAYLHLHGEAILLKTGDGINWSVVSQIHKGDRIDETALHFLPDGRMIVTGRLEGSESIWGHPQAATLIATASPPYSDWNRAKSRLTRLDGPRLFRHDGQMYAVGRFQPAKTAPLSKQGSVLCKKRTSLFLVKEDGLTYLSDLPSAGDTAYAGVAIFGNEAYVCYYTSRIDRDYPWIAGMIGATDIRMAKISLASLAAVAQSPPTRKTDSVSPWLDFLVAWLMSPVVMAGVWRKRWKPSGTRPGAGPTTRA